MGKNHPMVVFIRYPPGFIGKPSIKYGAILSGLGLVFTVITLAMGASLVWIIGVAMVLVGISWIARGSIRVAASKRRDRARSGPAQAYSSYGPRQAYGQPAPYPQPPAPYGQQPPPQPYGQQPRYGQQPGPYGQQQPPYGQQPPRR